MLEPCVRVLKEGIKVVFEGLEKWLRNQVLDRRWEFVVEVKLFDNQVEIVDESILDELFDRVVKLVRDLFFAVAVLESQKPKIKLFHPRVDKGFEWLVAWEHHTDSTGQKREESKSDELYTHGEDVLVGGVAGNVAVPDGGDGGQNEVECVHVDLPDVIILINVGVPGFCLLVCYEFSDPRIFFILHPDSYPDDRHDVSQ